MSNIYKRTRDDLYITTNKTPGAGDEVLVDPEVLRKRKLLPRGDIDWLRTTPIRLTVLGLKVRSLDGIPVIAVTMDGRNRWLDPTEYKTVTRTVYETDKDIPEVGDVYFIKRGSLKGVVGIITEVAKPHGHDHRRITLRDLSNDSYHSNVPYSRHDLKLVICHTKGTVTTIGDISSRDHVLHVSASPGHSSMLGNVFQVESVKGSRCVVANRGGWTSVSQHRLMIVKKRVEKTKCPSADIGESYSHIKSNHNSFQEKIHSIELQLESLKKEFEAEYNRGYNAGQEIAYQNGYKDGRAATSEQTALKYVLTNEHDERAAAERVVEKIRKGLTREISDADHVLLPISRVVSRDNKRQRLIEKAKKRFEDEVETLHKLGKEVRVEIRGDYKTGKTVSVDVWPRDLEGFILIGHSACTPSDCFNLHVGRYIALRRALKKEYSEFANGLPKAVRVSVGSIILYTTADKGVIELTVVENNGVYDPSLHIPLKDIKPNRIVQILDDTKL